MTSRPFTLLVAVLALAALTGTAIAAPEAAATRRSALHDSAVVPTFSAATAATFAQSEVCITDPSGDTEPTQDVRGDMTRFCLQPVGGSSVSLELTLAAAPRPDTANWIDGVTGWVSFIDVDGDRRADFEGYVVSDSSGGLVFDVTQPGAGAVVCSGSARVQGGLMVGDLDLQPCFGDSAEVVFYPVFVFDTNPADAGTQVVRDDTTNATAESDGPTTTPVAGPDRTVRESFRLSGASRFETAIAISRHQFPDGAEEVYLSRSDEFADSIAAASLTGGPVLLVPQCGQVPSAVLEEVRRLDPARIGVLGGTGAVCDDVVAQVAGA